MNESNKIYSKEYQTPLFRGSKIQDKLKGELHQEFEADYEKLPFITRVLVFFYGSDEYRDEMEDLKIGARFSSTRENLRVAYVTDENLIKKMKRKYSGDWFEKIGYSVAVLKRYDGKYIKYDITGGDKIKFVDWINKNTMKPVEEWSTDVSRMYEMLRQPVLLLFTSYETSEKEQQSNRAIKVFEKTSIKYAHVIGFVHTEIKIWSKERLRMFGIEDQSLTPQIAFNMMDSRVLVYPKENRVSKDELMAWLDGAFKGTVTASYIKPAVEIGDPELINLLNRTVITTPDNYVDTVFEEGVDTLLILYSSEKINNGMRNVAFQYNIVADALKQLRIETVRVASYDTN